MWLRDAVMAKTDANPPMMPFTDDYSLVEVDADYLSKAVKPKQFIHIDQTECIACEGCVDICPWKCIHMVSVGAIDAAVGGLASAAARAFAIWARCQARPSRTGAGRVREARISQVLAAI